MRGRTTNHQLRTIHCRREKSDQGYLPRTSPWPTSAGMSVRFCTLRALEHRAQPSHDLAEHIDRSPWCYATPPHVHHVCAADQERNLGSMQRCHRSVMKLIGAAFSLDGWNCSCCACNHHS